MFAGEAFRSRAHDCAAASASNDVGITGTRRKTSSHGTNISSSSSERHEHKSNVNPNPQPDNTQEEEEEEGEEAASSPSREKTKRRRIQIIEEEQEEEEEKELVFAPLSDASDVEDSLLTRQQYARKNAEYKPGDLIKVEYVVPGESMEHIGYCEVVSMGPKPARNSGEYRKLRIKWLYDRDDLLGEVDAPDREALDALDFEDGDWAYSNLEQELNVYNVVGKMGPDSTVEFMWDGTTLRPFKAEQVHGQPDDRLARHLCLAKEWLLSLNIWQDTKVGNDTWFALNSLMGMGHATVDSTAIRETLKRTFFDAEKNMEPKHFGLTWVTLDTPIKGKCNACGIQRMLTQRCPQLKWTVGVHCRARLDTLAHMCTFMANKRAEIKGFGERVPAAWLQAVSTELNTLRSKAMDAIAGAKTD